MNKTDIKLFLGFIASNGGVTYNMQNRTFNPIDGFMVSIYEHERVYPDNENKVREYLEEYLKDKISLLSSKHIYLGVWRYNGEIYFDISKRFIHEDKAINFAKENKQRAYYDCLQGKNIVIGYGVVRKKVDQLQGERYESDIVYTETQANNISIHSGLPYTNLQGEKITADKLML